MPYDYDCIVIGGGPVGLVSSKLAAGLGKKVALIEKERLGGDCTLTGCVPTKTLIASANYVHYAKEMNYFNCIVDTSCLDTSKILEHVRATIEEIYAGHTPKILEQEGINVIRGTASFKDNHTLAINGTTLSSKTFIIGAGALPFIPPIEGLDKVPYLTSKNFFSLTELPKSLLIIGGGPIGIEFASCLPKLGTQVTVIESNPTILPREDGEIVPLIEQTLREIGVNLKTGHTVNRAYTTDTGIALECTDTHKNTITFRADKLLIAVGRQPNVAGLALENAGVEYSRKGIAVNSTLQTTAKNIYAAGDIVGPYMFSHMAEYQAAIATRNALVPFFKKKVDYSQATWVTFSDPEIATAGLTEQQAREKHGDSIQIYRSYFKNSDRPRTDNRRTGLAKFILDKNGYLLGAHIYGARAGDLIGEIQLGKYYKIKLKDFYPVIHPYPTYSDVIWQASKKAYVDSLKNNWFLKVASKLLGKKKS